MFHTRHDTVQFEFNTTGKRRFPWRPCFSPPRAVDSSRSPLWGGPAGIPCRRGTRCPGGSRSPPSWAPLRSAGPSSATWTADPILKLSVTPGPNSMTGSSSRYRLLDTRADASLVFVDASAFCTLICASSCRLLYTFFLAWVGICKRRWMSQEDSYFVIVIY